MCNQIAHAGLVPPWHDDGLAEAWPPQQSPEELHELMQQTGFAKLRSCFITSKRKRHAYRRGVPSAVGIRTSRLRYDRSILHTSAERRDNSNGDDEQW
mmetsp:Transcript_41611/g.85581  ORF Transcript_41611/g.85581 Transcript_41611/m.85581 type:complete len:98 (+) Transcript_41611:1306-1599(+)